MVLPILAYGDPILRKPTEEIGEDYPDLKVLIESMYDTMYHANGVGLAAPQIGKSIRLFIVDSEYVLKDSEEYDEEGIKRVFINPEIIEETGDPWDYNEGCLSIPGIKEDVRRNDEVHIRYFDDDFNEYEEVFTGVTGRVIQHEYDHIEGILFTDHLKPLKKKMLKKRLTNISKGIVDVDYKMAFPMVK